MSITQKPASKRLAELEAAVEEARDRVRSIEVEQRQSNRKLKQASEPLHAYSREVGAGERDPDPELEAKLTAELGQVRSTATLRVGRGTYKPTDVSAVWVDERLEAKLNGARRALEDRERELAEYLRGNTELVSEWIAEAAEVRDACEARWGEVRAEFRAWQAMLGRWGPFLAANGIDPSELPAHPLRGIERDPSRGIALPAPESLLPDRGEGT